MLTVLCHLVFCYAAFLQQELTRSDLQAKLKHNRKLEQNCAKKKKKKALESRQDVALGGYMNSVPYNLAYSFII